MIPFVNQDGYDLVIKQYKDGINFPIVRKNQNPDYCKSSEMYEIMRMTKDTN